MLSNLIKLVLNKFRIGKRVADMETRVPMSMTTDVGSIELGDGHVNHVGPRSPAERPLFNPSYCEGSKKHHNHNYCSNYQQGQQPASPTPSEDRQDIMRPSHAHAHRQHSFRHRLSRTFSYPRQRWREESKSGSACNSTACAIAVCFSLVVVTLIISLFNAYMISQHHGFASLSEGAEESNNSPMNPEARWAGPGHFITPPTSISGPDEVDVDGRNGERRGRKAWAHVAGKEDPSFGHNEANLERLLIWKLHQSHNVDFSEETGLLTIQESGFYYVYSQVYFTDTQESDAETDPDTNEKVAMLVKTELNNEGILESLAPFNEFSTKYHGGVFHLNAGDRIGVSVSNNRLRISTASERSFFGVFMIDEE